MVASGKLEKALLDFLALECPPLLPAGRQALHGYSSISTVEKELRAALAELSTLPAGESRSVLYPGTDCGRASEWYRHYLEEIVCGFFRRWEIKSSITSEEKLKLYNWMVLTRTVDNRLKELFDSKEIQWGQYPSPMKGFRSFGQEAIVGAVLRLRRGLDMLAPLIRDLGVMLAWSGDIDNPILAQAGKANTPMEGRDLHIGDLDRGILPPTAPLAISTQTLVGMAYASKMDGSERVCVSFIGEGGSSLGEWHEAVNFAAVQKLNMIFILENNQWALGTRVSEQSAVPRFALKAAGYGIPGLTIFGNDPEEIAAACSWAADRARCGKGPTLVELVTYRRAGHAHHDDGRYSGMPMRKGYEVDEESALWAEADPIELYRQRLQADGILPDPLSIQIEAQKKVDEATDRMRNAPWPKPEDTVQVCAPRNDFPAAAEKTLQTRLAGYDEAIRMALAELMEADSSVFVIGEDVGGRYEGAFGVTRGLARRFGAMRCLNTPLAESAIIGCAVGAALSGKRPIVEIQFADFIASGFNSLVNNAAKIYWRYRKPVPLVVRLPYGGASKGRQVLLGGGPFHSQCPEAWLVRTPGLKIVAPAYPVDAKGLMAAAVKDPNPVLFLEAKGLYSLFSRDLREEVPLGADFEVPIGKAIVRRGGSDLTCIVYGSMVFEALDAAERLAREDSISMEVIDLRTIVPLDEEAILESVRKTHRVLIAHEDSRRGGFGAEIAAIICEKEMWNLEAPVVRVAAPDMPVPYSPPLEFSFLPCAANIVAAARTIFAE